MNMYLILRKEDLGKGKDKLLDIYYSRKPRSIFRTLVTIKIKANFGYCECFLYGRRGKLLETVNCGIQDAIGLAIEHLENLSMHDFKQIETALLDRINIPQFNLKYKAIDNDFGTAWVGVVETMEGPK